MKIIDKPIYEFSKKNLPLANADPGELLLFKSMDCFSNQIKAEKDLVLYMDYSIANPAAGPVYINGAEVGDVLVVDILDIKVANQGVICTSRGCGPLCDDMEDRTKVVKIDNNVAEFNNVKFHIDPMIGVIGTAPSGEAVDNGFPGNHGGNMDSKLIKKGSRVYFPVRTPGALLQMGDIHAVMGDAELCGTGIEVEGEILVKTSIIKNFELNWPVTETQNHWYVNASDHDYEKAVKYASKEMQRLMVNAYGWDKTDVYLYLSVQGNVEINQACKPCHVELILRISIPKLPDMNPLIR
ncbi:acetamidase [Clostridium autoethanogenum]|uniref:Acetamidase n=1 Tax=Clostridium autoethanogenum TaxID=84023 RepID=A0A3M0SR87_9CLOT|nr:acetamidase/formamidase family protein [Clostridium autoethanogenum]RMD01033.1 acetamidase [Clostridium autoethanogenum]